jgi:hypothetical protein
VTSGKDARSRLTGPASIEAARSLEKALHGGDAVLLEYLAHNDDPAAEGQRQVSRRGKPGQRSHQPSAESPAEIYERHMVPTMFAPWVSALLDLAAPSLAGVCWMGRVAPA